MALGQKIKHFRQRAKKSQRDIQVDTGIPQTTLSGWEAEKFEPKASELQKLATALGVSVAELLSDQPAATTRQMTVNKGRRNEL